MQMTLTDKQRFIAAKALYEYASRNQPSEAIRQLAKSIQAAGKNEAVEFVQQREADCQLANDLADEISFSKII